MQVYTDYLWFNTKKRQSSFESRMKSLESYAKAASRKAPCIVSAMHITGERIRQRLGRRPHSRLPDLARTARAGRAGLPSPSDGEDNADAHLKRTLMGHQVVLPITDGKLDLGPWEQVFYGEFDGQRKKRVIVKVMGI